MPTRKSECIHHIICSRAALLDDLEALAHELALAEAHPPLPGVKPLAQMHGTHLGNALGLRVDDALGKARTNLHAHLGEVALELICMT